MGRLTPLAHEPRDRAKASRASAHRLDEAEYIGDDTD
jgi:hypothetical protein